MVPIPRTNFSELCMIPPPLGFYDKFGESCTVLYFIYVRSARVRETVLCALAPENHQYIHNTAKTETTKHTPSHSDIPRLPTTARAYTTETAERVC